MNDLSRPNENPTMAEEQQPATGPGGITPETGIQALPPTDTGIQTLPEGGSAPAASTPPLGDVSLKQPETRLAFLDLVLATLLVLLAFLLGAFAIFHPDIWMHLASGRLLAHGEYQFGVDPFSYTTANVFWVNQSWLFDWLIYVINNLMGGEGLVVCKALLLVGLALVLLDVRRQGQSLWLPAIVIGLAMLALSMRAFLQPTVVSFLFLGLTIHQLVKARADGSAARRLWLLPVLFVLWVNLDDWFILGPITIFLFWLGSLLDGWTGRSRAFAPSHLGKVLLVGLAACLLNPHHVRAFALPNELADLWVKALGQGPDGLTASGNTLQQIRAVDRQFMNWRSPLIPRPGEPLVSAVRAFLFQPELNFAGLAYYFLLVIGLVSFVLPLIKNPREIHFPPLLVWVLFAFLSLANARMIPFFAVVGAAISLLNLQDYLAGVEWNPSQRAGRWLSIGRLATALAFLGLLFLAWPGWLHGQMKDFLSQRRFACKLNIDTSLYLAAFRLNEFQEQGKIRQGFSNSMDMACYCSWFAPQVKGFIDYRFGLFPQVAHSFATVRKALLREAQETMAGRLTLPDPDFPEWRDLAAKHDINHLVLTNFDRLSATRLLVTRLWLEKKKWPVLYEDGRTMVFGWTDNRDAQGKPLNPADSRLAEESPSRNKQAFTQVPADEQPSAFGSDFPGVDRSFWRKYFLGGEVLPLASDQAQLDHIYHQFWGQQWQRHYLAALQLTFPSTPAAFGVAGPGGLWLTACAGSLVRLPLLHAQDAGPPSDPVLMMRHARLGVSASDHNADAFLVLSNACKALWKTQEDHWSLGRGQGAPLRSTLRQIQTIAALKTALVLNPEDHRVHEILAEMYMQMHYLDVALEHYSLALRYVDRVRPSAGNRAARENFENYKKSLEMKVRGLDDEVKQRRADFDLRAAGFGPLEKFALALHRPYRPINATNRNQVDMQGFGLANRALTELRQAPLEQLKETQYFQLSFNQINLLLALGRLHEVAEDLPHLKKVLGPYQTHFQVLLAAATGNYALADQGLDEQIKNLTLEKRLADMASNYCRSMAPTVSGHGMVLANLTHLEIQNTAVVLLQKAAELYLVRGLLALEKGDVNLAAAYFQKTLDLVGTTVFFPDRPIAQRYLELIRKQ